MLAFAPLLASRDPLQHTGAVQVYLLGLGGVLPRILPTKLPKIITDAMPNPNPNHTAGVLIMEYPNCSQLWRF